MDPDDMPRAVSPSEQRWLAKIKSKGLISDHAVSRIVFGRSHDPLATEATDPVSPLTVEKGSLDPDGDAPSDPTKDPKVMGRKDHTVVFFPRKDLHITKQRQDLHASVLAIPSFIANPENKRPLPGPGSYAVTVQPATRMFGKISPHRVPNELDKALKEAATRPGPGEYNLDRHFGIGQGLNHGRISDTKHRSEVDIQLLKNKVPGPGHYGIPDAEPIGTTGFAFSPPLNKSALGSAAMRERDLPGPGSYDLTSHQKFGDSRGYRGPSFDYHFTESQRNGLKVRGPNRPKRGRPAKLPALEEKPQPPAALARTSDEEASLQSAASKPGQRPGHLPALVPPAGVTTTVSYAVSPLRPDMSSTLLGLLSSGIGP